MADEALDYLDDQRAADLARLIKDGAIFIRPEGAAAPTGLTWKPGEDSGSVGYYGDDGYVLTPVPGDSTDLTGHNGDVLVSEQSPGWWTVKFSGLEGRQRITAAYFDIAESDIGSDGSVTVNSAANNKRYDVVTVGLDQKGRPALIHYPSVQISEKEGITFNRTTLLALGITFRTFKGGTTAPYHMRAWGLILDED